VAALVGVMEFPNIHLRQYDITEVSTATSHQGLPGLVSAGQMGPFCMEFACSLHAYACVGFALLFPIVQRYAYCMTDSKSDIFHYPFFHLPV